MPNRSLGFTLIEVLISMILLAIGLLGLASLQAMALRDNQDAYYYQQATLLAYEMQDRIRANVNFTDWTTVIPQQGNNCNAPQNPCTPLQLAAYDYWYWQTKASQVLPVTQNNFIKPVEIQSSKNVNKGNCIGSYETSLCLIIRWSKNQSQNTDTLMDTSTFYLEVTP
jgi:type IV pilus assembly protein PilV